MIRDLRLNDVPRQLLPGRLCGEDWAYTRSELATAGHRLSRMELLRWSVDASKSRHALASLESGRLLAVVLLQIRGGMRAWEFGHLFASHDGLRRMGELLDHCVGCVAQRGGERLFLRVLYRSRMQEIARSAGFLPAFTEETFVLRRPMSAPVEMPTLGLRPVLPSDAYGLFRLYNAAVPVAVRGASGLTLDQWADAREEPGGVLREYVWEHDGRIRAWLRLAHRGREVAVDGLLHPDNGAHAQALAANAAQVARSHSSAAWTIPSYQPMLSLVLQRHGWELSRTYAVLVRSVASRVKEPALMPVRA